MNISNLIAFGVILAGVVFSVQRRKLTFLAAPWGGSIASVLFWGAGFTGIALLAVFFISGSMVTSWKLDFKIRTGVAAHADDMRNTWQVVANAGLAAMLAVLIKYHPGYEQLFLIMIAGCFSAATADTLSSELGNVYGKRYYHILSLQEMQRGENGAVSLPGIGSGIFGSAVIALVYVLGTGWDIQSFLIVVFAGTAGNVADSVLGLSLENKGLLNNNAVNFLNTAAGAITAGLLLVM